MRRTLRLITTLIMIIAVLSGFSVAHGAVVRIQVAPYSEDITSLPLHVGIKKCFFKEEELEPEISYGICPSSGIYALHNGEIDYYIGSPAHIAMFIATEKLPIRIIFFYFDKNLLYLMAQSQIKSIGDLEGKTIGIDFHGSIIDYALRRTLKKHELDPDKDVIIRDLYEVPRAITALVVERSVHAAVLPLPSNTFAEREDFHELSDFREEIASIPLLALATTEKKIENNSGQVEKMLKIARKSLLYTREYKDDVVNIMKDLMEGVDKETLPRIYDYLIEGLSQDGYIDTKGLHVFIQRTTELFKIKEEISISKIFNLDLLKEKVLEIYRLIVIPVAAQCISPKRPAVMWHFYYWLTKDASSVIATVLIFKERQYIWSEEEEFKPWNEQLKFVWDGRHEETKEYARPGKYTCKIKSVDIGTGNVHINEEDFFVEQY